jgi:hypothetical protein
LIRRAADVRPERLWPQLETICRSALFGSISDARLQSLASMVIRFLSPRSPPQAFVIFLFDPRSIRWQ